MNDPAREEEGEGVVFPVPASLDGERVDRALALVTGYSRADVQDLVARGAVLVDGAAVSKSRRLHEGETVAVTARPEAAGPPGPEPVPLEVRYEDGALAVLAKPPGLVVHPGAGNEHGTLVHGLLHRWPAAAGVGDPMRPGIVHRLDRDTSGLLVVALRPEAYEALVAALAGRQVERRYTALVWGNPEPRRGVVDAPVGRSVRRPTRMAVTPRGRDARTHYEVQESFRHPDTSLLDITLETGRTHQIRVHLSAIGHPVVGDPAYGGDRPATGRSAAALGDVPRMFLHAGRLALAHPLTGERLAFEEPLPPDLEAVLARLRQGGS